MTLWAVATGGMVHGSCPSFEMGRVVTRRRVGIIVQHPPRQRVVGPLQSVVSRVRTSEICLRRYRTRTMNVKNFAGWDVCSAGWQLTLRNFSTLAWAFGAAGVADVKLLTRIGDAVSTRSGDLD